MECTHASMQKEGGGSTFYNINEVFFVCSRGVKFFLCAQGGVEGFFLCA